MTTSYSCARCGGDLGSGDGYCAHCGAVCRCPECSTPLASAEAMCPQCGALVDPPVSLPFTSDGGDSLWTDMVERLRRATLGEFELGPEHAVKGVVRSEELQLKAVDEVREFARDVLGLTVLGVVPAGIKGPKGNQEYLLHLRR